MYKLGPRDGDVAEMFLFKVVGSIFGCHKTEH